jgi:predicted GIY-YIG superfamily endonuclease
MVYAIQSIKYKQIYIGQTENIKERLCCHNSGYVKSTKGRIPWVLIAFEEFEGRNKARWVEKELKMSNGKRLRWIKKNHVDI